MALTKILLGLSVDTGKCSDGVNIIIVITIVKDIKVWINAVFTWWGWLISAGYDHVPWLDRSHLRFHKRSRVHHNSIEEWSPIAIQHFHFTGWRQCTKASQASYSVSVERIFKMALISFVSSSCLYSFWLRCPLRCEDGASEAGERIRGEPIDKQNINKLISEIDIPSASDSVSIALTGKASFCHKWKGIMCDLVERLANWAFEAFSQKNDKWRKKLEEHMPHSSPPFNSKPPTAPTRLITQWRLSDVLSYFSKWFDLDFPLSISSQLFPPFCPLPSFCGAAAASGFKPQGEQVPLGLMSPFAKLMSDVWVFIILLS